MSDKPIGRVYYTVETDDGATDYSYNVYTLEARDRGLREARAAGYVNVEFRNS